jgi:tetratricopeptide (TPR) repeat protein
VQLADGLLAIGQVDEAIGIYRQVLERHPKISEAHLRLGKALQARGSADEAIVSFRTALELQPESSEAQQILAAALGGSVEAPPQL